MCNAAPNVHDESVARGFVAKLAPYMPQCCVQTFAASTYLRELQPSPWELLSERLSDALLLIGLRFPNLRNKVARSLLTYLDQAGVVASSFAGVASGLANGSENTSDDAVKAFAFATSLIGYMNSIARHASFWTPDERLHILSSLESLLSDSVLLSTELTLSALRSGDMQNSKTENLKHLMKRYASQGRPLSGILLRQGLVAFVEACAALLVAAPGSLQ